MTVRPRLSLVRMAHACLGPFLRPGDWAVDATVGNGGDTVFLARAVGPTGRVFGFDIQAAALERAERRLVEEGFGERVTLRQVGHQHFAEVMPLEARGRLRCAMFNLGYLPGGDRTRTTRAETTVAALRQTWEWLGEGGVVSIIAYPGHPGGAEEAAAVAGWVESVRTAARTAYRTQVVGRPEAPVWWLVMK
ncbi:MAG: class I SAM-dependent methyltransferase [Alicyclobacillaceae bacterium]|nr:class I SAM-dependent methyltransferase [Alicyclobacillaceae bacterium]